jgi:hypothetical protein
MTSKAILRVILVAAGVASVSLAAAPAMASGQPVTAQATVTQSITISGLSPSITFPAAAPGSPVTVTGAENYTVSANDAHGYTLTITPSGSALADGSGDQIANSNVFVTETTGPGSGQFSGPAPLQVGHTTAPSSDSYSENWGLTVPGGQAAGNYSETFTYLALGNA